MAKKKPALATKEEVKKASKKEIIVNLKIKEIVTQVYETKKEGVKEILKVSFTNASNGVSVTLKGSKKMHPLRHWDKAMLDTKEDIAMTLSVPSTNQKKITDYKDPTGHSEGGINADDIKVE